MPKQFRRGLLTHHLPDFSSATTLKSSNIRGGQPLASVAPSRRRVVALAVAVTSAAAAVLRRLKGVPLHGGGLLDGLLQLHAALAVRPESLACSMGHTAATDAVPVLQVQSRHLSNV